MPVDAGGFAIYQRGVVILAVVLGSIVVLGTPKWAKPLQIGTLVAAHCAIGVWMIQRSPDPAIDVHVFQRDAFAALRAGVNPYAMTFPNIYQTGENYGPGLSVNGRLQFGFPYFPLSLLLSMPAQLFGGDERYAQLAAIELAAVLMAFARPRGLGAGRGRALPDDPSDLLRPRAVVDGTVSRARRLGGDLRGLPSAPPGPVALRRIRRAEAIPGVRAARGGAPGRMAHRSPEAGHVPREGGAAGRRRDAAVRGVGSSRVLDERRDAAVPSAVSPGRAQPAVVVGEPGPRAAAGADLVRRGVRRIGPGAVARCRARRPGSARRSA